MKWQLPFSIKYLLINVCVCVCVCVCAYVCVWGGGVVCVFMYVCMYIYVCEPGNYPGNNYLPEELVQGQLLTSATTPLISTHQDNYPPKTITPVGQLLPRKFPPLLGQLPRETSDPSGTAQNEQNNNPWTAPLVPVDQISDMTWRGSICLGVLYLIPAWTTHRYVVTISSQGPHN